MNTNFESESPKFLYRLGGAAALLMAAIIFIQFISFMIEPPPYQGTVQDWFALFDRSPLFGLIGFELLMVVYMLVSIPLSLALYLRLKSTSPAFTALYLALSLVGVGAFISARPALEMLHLSQEYAAAASQSDRTMFLAAGQALVSRFDGAAFHTSYILGSLTGLLISLVMLKSQLFSRGIAIVRIASSLCDFGLYIPLVGMYISIFSVLFLLIWDVWTGLAFLRLARGSDERAVKTFNPAFPAGL